MNSISISSIIELSDFYLSNWLIDKKIKSLFLIGSHSVNEASSSSDIDLLAIVEHLTGDENTYRKQLKAILPENSKIGLRTRTIDEVPSFQKRMQIWGYDLVNAVPIFGSSQFESIPQQPISLGDIQDALIERVWCDNLFSARARFDSLKMNNLNIKSILDVFNFNLLLAGHRTSSHRERLSLFNEYSANNKHNLFPFDRSVLIKIIDYKLGRTRAIEICDLQEIRTQYIDYTWDMVGSNIDSTCQSNNCEYWGVSEVDLDIIYLQLDSVSRQELYLHFRKTFFTFISNIDKVRLGVADAKVHSEVRFLLLNLFNPIFEVKNLSTFGDLNLENLADFFSTYESMRQSSFRLAKRDWSY